MCAVFDKRTSMYVHGKKEYVSYELLSYSSHWAYWCKESCLFCYVFSQWT